MVSSNHKDCEFRGLGLLQSPAFLFPASGLGGGKVNGLVSPPGEVSVNTIGFWKDQGAVGIDRSRYSRTSLASLCQYSLSDFASHSEPVV